jgi:hypothetical protein
MHRPNHTSREPSRSDEVSPAGERTCHALKTRDLIRAKNPELDQLGTILEAWHKAHGDKPLTINDAIKEDSVRIACFAVEPGEGGKPNARAIGKLLGRHEGRVVHGLRIDQAGKRQNYVVWRVSREP